MINTDDIEFIILCGGKSTRNYPHTKGISHKALLPFGSKRIIDYILSEIIKIGGKNITIVCSSEKVVDDFRTALAKDTEVYEKLKKKNALIAENLEETFLPNSVNVRYVIQSLPKGTAHAIGLAHNISKDKNAVVIFPDDIYFSQPNKINQLGRLIEDFRRDDKQILLTGIVMDDVSNVSVLENGRLIEKPKQPISNVGGFSPMLLPKAVCDLMSVLAERIENGESVPEMRTDGECCYVDAINSFLDNSYNKYFAKMLIKDDDTEYFDAGNVMAYEKLLIRGLLEYSRFKNENKEYVVSFLR